MHADIKIVWRALADGGECKLACKKVSPMVSSGPGQPLDSGTVWSQARQEGRGVYGSIALPLEGHEGQKIIHQSAT